MTNPRFSLRFDSGERQGDLVPVPPGGFLVGRRPGSSLQVLDSSVSGKHAELVVDEKGCLVRDLGSTNGTRVNGERVLEERVSQGDEVVFGNIKFTVQEAGLAADDAGSGLRGRVKAEGVARAEADTGEDVGGVSAEMLARAGKGRGSKVGLLALLLVLGGGGAALWFLNQGQQAGGDEANARAVEEVPGNLVSDPSFEDGSGLSDWEQASTAFTLDASAASSGENGLVAELEAGEWALALTEPVALGASTRGLEVRADLAFFESGAEGRVGLQFTRELPAGEDEEPIVQALWSWSAPVSGSEDFDESSFTQAVPNGFRSVRVVLLAQAKGNGPAAVYADDVVLLPTQEVPGAESPLVLLGGEPSGAFLRGGNDSLSLIGLHCKSPAPPATEEGEVAAEVPGLGFGLEVGQVEFGGSLTPQTSAGGTILWTGRIDGELAAQGLATIGESGYQAHAGPFQRDAVSELLLGERNDLVSLRFASPVRVELSPSASGLRFRATCPNAAAAVLNLRLDFQTERATAGDLAYEARKAQKAGELGSALLLWTRLLDEAPYDAELVAEAEAQRSQLARGGLEEVQSVRQLLERARFFRLADLFGRARDEAAGLAERYVGTEVEVAARDLESTITAESAQLESDRSSLERARLERIHAGLLARDAQGLAQEVQNYLEESF